MPECSQKVTIGFSIDYGEKNVTEGLNIRNVNHIRTSGLP